MSPSREAHAPFPTTAWTMICQAQQISEMERRQLLGQLLRNYWKPLYSYFRANGNSAPDAQDLVQEVVSRIALGDGILQVQPGTRFRNWLLKCAQNLMIDDHRRRHAKKRRPQGGLLLFDDLVAADGAPFEPVDSTDPDEAYRATWRRELLKRALGAVEELYNSRGEQIRFRVFADFYLCLPPAKPGWAEIAERHGLASAREAAYFGERVKGDFASAIRQEIRRYVDNDEDVDDEIRDLLF